MKMYFFPMCWNDLICLICCRRMFEESRHELYVCYEENISQTMVEMAFKLLFGSATV